VDKKMPKKKIEDEVIEEVAVGEPVEEVVAETAAPAETVEVAEEKPKKAKKAAKVEEVVEEVKSEATTEDTRGHRSQRTGIVTSDKMTKTVVVRVDRLIKHPVYRKYVRRRKKFMAHDETGATIGDKVLIVETRPLSARKRWRVLEIIQKAAK
jgi:small subunit ribosomal protein S17